MPPGDAGLTQAQEVVGTLVKGPAQVEHLVTGGRNSRIYHVRCPQGEFALKQYPSRADDPRDRLATEVGALDLMKRHKIDIVPRVIGVDADRGFALLSWINGTEVVDIAGSDIDAAVAFLTAVHGMRNSPWAKAQPLASEACLSGTEIERQIVARRDRLRKISGEPDLAAFLDGPFAAALEQALTAEKSGGQAAGLDFEAELSQEWRALVPSDFGFHNSLRRPDGSLAFVDFEYFGWDDPAKMTADLMLHPGRVLGASQRRKLRRLTERLYGEDWLFGLRLTAYFHLFGLRWVLILLNEFIPERWQRRVLAGASEDWAAAKAAQLAGAAAFLAALPEKLEG